MSEIAAAYGVLLTPEDCNEINKFHDDGPGSYPDERLKEKYQAPEDTWLIYTGNDEDREDPSRVPSESWILGYGLGEFPRDVDEEFKRKAKWWLWVVDDV